jgi:hypothetical protein
MGLYSVDKLMAETRRLAAEYHKTTGQTLPVTTELSKHYAMRALRLVDADATLTGVDAKGQDEKSDLLYQIKGRVIFDSSKASPRIGQLNMDADWNMLVLVTLDAEYFPVEIYAATKKAAIAAMGEKSKETSSRQKRGAMSVAKFKAIAQLVWTPKDGDLT